MKSSIEHIWAQQTCHNAITLKAIIPLIICAVLLLGCVPLNSSEVSAPVALPEPINTPTSHTSKPAVTQIEVFEPNRAELKQIDGETFIEVHSPKGIGNAQLRIDHELPPKPFTVRFYLQGLEHLQISTGQLILVASISALDGSTVIQEVATQKDEESTAVMEQVDAESPYWLEIQTAAAENKSTADGFIDVRIPERFVAESEPTITLEWVDFYR